MANESGGSANHVNILVMSTDLALAKSVQTACQTVAAENSDKNYRVFPGVSKDKVVEALDKYQFHSILIEEEFITDTTPEKYVVDFSTLVKSKRPDNADTAIVLVSSKSEGSRNRMLVKSGWSDILVKPLDRTLFLQKMSLYNTKIPFLKESLLFNMDMEKDLDVSFSFKMNAISEYGMSLTTDRELVKGMVVGIGGKFLEASMSAVVTECVKGKDEYAVQVMFIGVSPAETQAIRKLIRQEYAEEKQAG